MNIPIPIVCSRQIGTITCSPSVDDRVSRELAFSPAQRNSGRRESAPPVGFPGGAGGAGAGFLYLRMGSGGVAYLFSNLASAAFSGVRRTRIVVGRGCAVRRFLRKTVFVCLRRTCGLLRLSQPA